MTSDSDRLSAIQARVAVNEALSDLSAVTLPCDPTLEDPPCPECHVIFERIYQAFDTALAEARRQQAQKYDVAGGVWFSCGPLICQTIVRLLRAQGNIDYGCRFCVPEPNTPYLGFVCLQHGLESILQREDPDLLAVLPLPHPDEETP